MSKVEELEQRIAILEKELAAVKETLLMIGNVNASEELRQYIDTKCRAANMVRLINNISDSNIPTKQYDDKIKSAIQSKAEIDADIAVKMNNVGKDEQTLQVYIPQTQIQLPPHDLFDYEVTNHNSINIKRFDLTYNADNNKDDVLIVPKIINGLPVTTIGYNAFEKSHISKIILPETVTRIEHGAFRECRILSEIFLPDSIEDIGTSVFQGCNCLTEIRLPRRLEELGEALFMYCTNLKNIVIPSGVTTIGINCFSACYKLTDLTLPSGLTKIMDFAFCKCQSLTSVTIPYGVSFIPPNCFDFCNNLEQVVLQEGVTRISVSAFRETALRKINIPSTVHRIDLSAFCVPHRLHVLFEGNCINFNIGAFNCPTTFYYKNKFILKDLYRCVTESDKYQIDHDVTHFYQI